MEVHRDVVQHPVVQRPVIFELQRAQRVRDALERIADAVGEVVHRVDAPVIAGPVMGGVTDPVDHRVAHVHVRRRHVDLGTQHVLAVRECARAHAAEEIQVLGDCPVPMRARRTGLGQRAAGAANLVRRQAADVGLAPLDELLGESVKLREVIRGKGGSLPVEAEPGDVALNRLDEVRVLPLGVRVVVAQVRLAAELLGDAEIQTDRLGMADVQVAVGLGRKPCHHAGRATGQVAAYAVANEVAEIGGHGYVPSVPSRKHVDCWNAVRARTVEREAPSGSGAAGGKPCITGVRSLSKRGRLLRCVTTRGRAARARIGLQHSVCDSARSCHRSPQTGERRPPAGGFPRRDAQQAASLGA